MMKVKYLSPGSPEEINISSREKRQTLEHYHTGERNVFDDAQRAVFDLLRNDSWRAYRRSELNTWSDEAHQMMSNDSGRKRKEKRSDSSTPPVPGVTTSGEGSEEAAHARQKELQARQKEMMFRKAFAVELPPTEQFCASFTCSLEKQLVMVAGEIGVFERRFCFTGTMFGVPQKICLDMRNIAAVDAKDGPDGGLVICGTDGKMYSFSQFGAVGATAAGRGQDAGKTWRDALAVVQKAWDANRLLTMAASSAQSSAPDQATPTETPQDGLTDEVTWEDWQPLLQGATCLELKKDEVILQEGKPVLHLYQVSTGSVKLEKSVPDGSTMSVTSLGAGDMYGGANFITGAASTYALTADCDGTKVYEIPFTAVRTAMSTRPEAKARLLLALARVIALHHSQQKDDLIAQLTNRVFYLEAKVRTIQLSKIQNEEGDKKDKVREAHASMSLPKSIFSQDLWDQYDAISSFVNDGMHVSREICQMIKLRSDAERDYATNLAKVARMGRVAIEKLPPNTVVLAWTKMVDVLDQFVKIHTSCADVLQRDIVLPLQTYTTEVDTKRKELHARYYRETAKFDSLRDNLLEMRRKYRKHTQRAFTIQEYIDRGNADKAKLQSELGVANFKANTYHAAYQASVQECNAYIDEYFESVLVEILDSLQDLEDSRISRTKLTLKRCINTEKQMSHDIGIVEMNEAVQRINRQSDIQSFARSTKTGKQKPSKFSFEDYIPLEDQVL
eukprot:TRINITY_DN4337_c0_g1::TRINITY_DN4337_c0_g1_i1::g.21172::m.21172 TRINITY_DN4337_c0_g1::TRINITY_DN4337_c0_g1_i1::g.21172  ORF type:complete len:731 (-),score=204.27,sp/Q555L8/Y4695_DICDI/22.66/2e-12,cNMP_binding/PF00027.24/2.1e-11,FCH/PF00611.18/4.1e-10,RGS/PF00615.14/6.8e-08,RGS/PF00615.14/1.6e+03,GRAM/PF02893.15/0.00091,SapB_2/PF03489.12/3.8e+03,SapB_2/PF03489.12/3.7e+02,SapB_2/PF03489.12/3.4 TRINITY_DN4337_c0_g1_i1:95-2287(-)